MTKFEEIKNMNVVELAIYINRLQNEAIENYEKGHFPKAIVENISMLNEEMQ